MVFFTLRSYFYGELVDESINLKGPSISNVQTKLDFYLFTKTILFSYFGLGPLDHF